MPQVTTQHLNPMSWLVAPALICAGAEVVLGLPITLFGARMPEPVWAMAPAFAWAGLRPSILPPFVLVALGLFQDILWGAPLGFWPLCLLALYGLAFSVRPILSGQGFWAMGAWYGAACGLGFGVGLLISIALSGVVPNLLGLAMQWAVTVALFPLAQRLIVFFEDADVRFR